MGDLDEYKQLMLGELSTTDVLTLWLPPVGATPSTRDVPAIANAVAPDGAGFDATSLFRPHRCNVLAALFVTRFSVNTLTSSLSTRGVCFLVSIDDSGIGPFGLRYERETSLFCPRR